MKDRLLNEPALVIGFAQAVLACVVGFGLDLSGEQVALIVGVVAAAMACVTRSQVTPTRKARRNRYGQLMADRGHGDVVTVALVILVVVVILMLLGRI